MRRHCQYSLHDPLGTVLTDDDWTKIALERRGTDRDQLRSAMADLRDAGRSRVAEMIMKALRQYGASHGGGFPSHLSDLALLAPAPGFSEILQRYTVTQRDGQSWVREKAPQSLDPVDQLFRIGPDGFYND